MIEPPTSLLRSGSHQPVGSVRHDQLMPGLLVAAAAAAAEQEAAVAVVVAAVLLVLGGGAAVSMWLPSSVFQASGCSTIELTAAGMDSGISGKSGRTGWPRHWALGTRSPLSDYRPYYTVSLARI